MCFNIFLKVIPLSLKQLLLFCLYLQFKYIYFIILCWFLPYIMNMYVRSLLNLPPSHPSPLGCNRAPDLSSLCIQQISTGYLILHMVIRMFQCYSICPTLSSPHPPNPLVCLYFQINFRIIWSNSRKILLGCDVEF